MGVYTRPSIRHHAGGVLAGNSTSTLLTNGSTFTGEWVNVSEWSSIVVAVKTDQDGTYTVQFSPDGSNADSTLPYTYVNGEINPPKRLTVTRPFVRVTFTNNSGSDQTYLRLKTMVGEFTTLTSTMGAQVGADFDATVVRQLDTNLSIALGDWENVSRVDKFGYCPAVGTTERVLWGVEAAFNGFLTTATTVRVKAGNTNDTAAGTGARSVTVQGLDETFALAEETITTAGTSASSATSTTFIRVFRVFVASSGAYRGANTGAVTIENGSGGTDLAYIAAGVGQSEMAIYTIPAGYTGYLNRLGVFADGNKVAQFRLYRAEDASDATTPFKPKRIIRRLAGVDGPANETLPQYVELSEKSDVWMTAFTSGSTANVSGDFGLFIVKN